MWQDDYELLIGKDIESIMLASSWMDCS